MGIAMSITAFPVLAPELCRSVGFIKRLGAIVITCAAADDITAWCLLAVVIAIVKAGDFVGSVRDFTSVGSLYDFYRKTVLKT
jgi:Kef-type K+ transport system membrane component KefB